ncbi:TatD family hydrolase [Candidatus Bathyarchaeota archaeon]|nr:TatD family hydrolase [Candidatus Bathyarchaeota archaeon]
MCGGEAHDAPARAPASPDFPWDAGVIDAHCHPTDTMASAEGIPKMKARALTIMATRSQDQDLVASVASRLGLASPSALSRPDTTSVVPSFGWHPWFSHQLVDDRATSSVPPPADPDSEEAVHKFKTRHYTSILTPPPTDPAFIAQLPTPTPLSSFIDATRSRAAAHPVALIGEVGLDKAFRLPDMWTADGPPRDASLTPGGREGRRLSPHGVAMGHQVAVLQAQLALAGELQLPVSVHGVQAHGVLYDAVAAQWKGYERDVLSKRERQRVAPHAEDWSSSSEDEDEDEGGDYRPKAKAEREDQKKGDTKPFPPRICLHSFSGSTEVLRRYLKPAVPADVYFSLSTAVNFATPAAEKRFAEAVKEIPDDRILVESDLHTAGPAMDAALEEMYTRVCERKGWGLREGVERIGRNYEAFVFG